MRTCIGCRNVKPVQELQRFVRAPDGTVFPAATDPGRGAWVCALPHNDCLQSALTTRAFARAFRAMCRTDGLGDAEPGE